MGTESMELQSRFDALLEAARLRFLAPRFATVKYVGRRFRSVQRFNGDDYGLRVLILRGTRMKTSRLSSIRPG